MIAACRHQVSLGVSTPGDPSLSDLSEVGYKCFMWHLKADGSMPMFNGAYGQRVSTRQESVSCFVDLRGSCWIVTAGRGSEGLTS